VAFQGATLFSPSITRSGLARRLRRSSIIDGCRGMEAEPPCNPATALIMPGLETARVQEDLWVPQRGIQFVYLVLLLPS